MTGQVGTLAVKEYKAGGSGLFCHGKWDPDSYQPNTVSIPPNNKEGLNYGYYYFF